MGGLKKSWCSDRILIWRLRSAAEHNEIIKPAALESNEEMGIILNVRKDRKFNPKYGKTL